MRGYGEARALITGTNPGPGKGPSVAPHTLLVEAQYAALPEEVEGQTPAEELTPFFELAVGLSMKLKSVSVRAPVAWHQRVDSRLVRRWLAEYFGSPWPLPPDPGPGEAFLRLSLPGRAVKALEAATGDAAGVALRRLISSRLELPAASCVDMVPVAKGVSVGGHRGLAAVSQRAVAGAHEVGLIGGATRGPAAERTELMACFRCDRMTLHLWDGRGWNCEVCEARDRSDRMAWQMGLLEPGWGPPSARLPTVIVSGEERRTVASDGWAQVRIWFWILVGAFLVWALVRLLRRRAGKSAPARAVPRMVAGSRIPRFVQWTPVL